MEFSPDEDMAAWLVACLRQSWQNLAQSVFSPPILHRHRHVMLPAFLFLEEGHDEYNDDDEEPGDRSGGNHDSDNEVVDGGDEEEYNIRRGGNENE